MPPLGRAVGVVGYHIRLTRERCSVRFRDSTFSFCPVLPVISQGVSIYSFHQFPADLVCSDQFPTDLICVARNKQTENPHFFAHLWIHWLLEIPRDRT